MFRLRKLLLLTSLIALSPLSYADAVSFDNAVNEYLKGFRACNDANNLRSSNIIEANKKFMYYKQQLDTAISIDESILSSTERDMNKNLAYCQRVEDNLKRAEATPILQHAFTYCEAARGSYETGQLKQARDEFEEYRRYKEDAYAITATIDEVFVLASQVRSCGRFEEKLAKKEQEAVKQQENLKQVVALYQKYKLECDSTLAYASRANFKINELPTANRMLNAANKHKKSATEMKGALEFANANPQAPEAIELASLQESSRICEGAVKERLRKKTKEKRALQSFLTLKNKDLESSLAQCNEAQKEANATNLKGATAAYQQSASLKKKATGSKTVNLVKGYPNWKETATYNQLLKQTKQCQDRAAKSINKLQAAIEQAKAAAEAAAAAEQEAQKEKEKAAQEEALVQQETQTDEKPATEEQTAPIIEEPTETVEAEEQAKPETSESEKTTTQEDLNDPSNWDDAEFEDEEDNLEEDNDGKRKSWTDLVQ